MDKKQLLKIIIGDLSWQRLIKSCLFLYIFFAGFVYFRADSMIFLPQPSSYQDNQKILKLASDNNTKISATYLLNSQAEYTILYAHGNAEDLGNIKQTLEQLYAWGFSVFSYDYRGYGTSEGTPTENNAYQDIDTAYNYLTQHLKISPKKIIVWGRSVGGGSAVNLAAKKPVAGLIIESTFISAFQVIVPFRILPFDKFSNIDKIKNVNCPILVVHGKSDEVIPFSHGEKLFAAASSPKLSFWVDRASHNDLLAVAGDKYKTILNKFIKILKNPESKIN
ncbi:MAG: alpha/beta hydrolase [Nostoc sp. ChiSLP02]|nr:alpha/beta hydrolase [Nostoc sp. DedSLP05]MDZ8097950.1 alpha/beta hydrolase [Nostoc sp. DedSLP01]MDZ8187967.1 alpha/beta hydrolase [Nostoc sp. ChiSLP02]